jgi:hypothetical protein
MTSAIDPTKPGTPQAWTVDMRSNFSAAKSEIEALQGGAAQPSDALPIMAGTAIGGTSVLYARGDHVHPTDTSRAPIASPTFTGMVTINTSTSTPMLNLNAVTGISRTVQWQTNGVARWQLFIDQSAESGGNAGSAFNLFRFDDSGNSLGSAITIARNTGAMSFNGTVSINSTTLNVGTSAITSSVVLNGPTGTNRGIYWQTAGGTRWSIRANATAESGSNAGSDFNINSFTDAAGALGTPLSINRASGLVTMANGASITGGTSDNHVIGGTTPTAGTFTTLTTGTNTTSGTFNINGPVASNRTIVFATAGSRRWIMLGDNSSESGSNAGSNFAINRYDDTTNFIDQPLTINRATGLVRMAAGAAITGGNIDNNVIGATTPAAGTFTNLAVTGATAVIKAGTPSGIISIQNFGNTPMLTINPTNATVTSGLGFVYALNAGPTWSGGTGAPASTQPVGSLYSRTDGAVGTTLYVSRGAGTWNPVAGV